ncbi:MAG: polyphosphate kinase 2 family protein [Gammaproteobacteria bacterium]|nr:polyphosphate kinase 2 family protein [Gammaproteobacteria bacterium]
MFKAVPSSYLVPHDSSFDLEKALTVIEDRPKKKALKKALQQEVQRLHDLQRVFYAHDRHSLLLVFQAMDAAGKDSTIRSVMSGINPAGCQVFSFKKPSSKELDHDFLWRTNCCMPERGRIGIFNRSYYEEVLVVRVHPEYLKYQRLPNSLNLETLWSERLESINDMEKHMARNGTVIVKFWLNVSMQEQKRRFLSRLNEPEKNWKFAVGDVVERGHWDDYMKAYQEALNATSTPSAPWYAIPADNKPYMRLTVARIIRQTLESLSLNYPRVDSKEQARFDEMRQLLENE